MNKRAEINLTSPTHVYFYAKDSAYALRLEFSRQSDSVNFVFVDMMPFAPDLSFSGDISVDELVTFLRTKATLKVSDNT